MTTIEQENARVCKTCGIKKSELPEGQNLYWQPDDERICSDCSAKEKQKMIDEYEWEEGDTDYEDDIICPYCGTKHEADGEGREFYKEGCHDFQCGECESDFTVSTMISFSYSTTR